MSDKQPTDDPALNEDSVPPPPQETPTKKTEDAAKKPIEPAESMPEPITSQTDVKPTVAEKIADQETPQEVVKEKIVEKIVEKEVRVEVPVVDEQLVEQRVREQAEREQTARRRQANEARRFRRQERLEHIAALASKLGSITNHDIRDALHVGQSTVTRYLRMLLKAGALARFGKGKATRYKRKS